MIAKIRRGKKMSGLIVYLLGPGEHNEHKDRHIIGGSPTVMREMWLAHFDGPGDDEAARDVALAVADEIEIPRRLYGTQVRMKAKVAVGVGGRELGMDVFEPARKSEKGTYKDAPVWHCVLAAQPGEELSDDRWQEIAGVFMERMGFTATPDAQRAQARWVAVRHGHSGEKGEGQDHIHIAASLVREDGSKVSTYDYGPGKAKGDWPRADEVCGEIEREFGLKILATRKEGGGLSENSRAEIERAKRLGTPETERERLRRMVRAHAVGAESEREFVENLREAGVAVRARYAAGGTSEVTGYSVRLRRGDAEIGPWLGGGKLAKDLSLSALREQQWADSPEAREDALAAWKGRADRGKRSGRSRGEGIDPWAQAAAEVEQWQARLGEIPVSDRGQWAWMAGQAAGVFAAWSEVLEGDEPGAFAAAAREMTRSAQVARQADRWRPPRERRPGPIGEIAQALLTHTGGSRPRTHLPASQGARDGQAAAEMAVLLLALMVLALLAAIAIALAVARAHRARGELMRASAIEHVTRTQIDPVRAGWESELAARRDQWDRDAAQVFAAAAGRAAARHVLGDTVTAQTRVKRPAMSAEVAAAAAGPLTPPATNVRINRPYYTELTEEQRAQRRVVAVARAWETGREVEPRRWDDERLDAELAHRRTEIGLLADLVAARRDGRGPHTVAVLADNAELRRQVDKIRPARDAQQAAEEVLAEQQKLTRRHQALQQKLDQTPRRQVLARRELASELAETQAALAELAPKQVRTEAVAQAAAEATGIPAQEWNSIEFQAQEQQRQARLRGAQDKDQRELAADAKALEKLQRELGTVEAEQRRRSQLTGEQRDAEQRRRAQTKGLPTRRTGQSADNTPAWQQPYPPYQPDHGRDHDTGLGR
ncbi:relaxase/mobilization nuclease domain-containing protein [Nocardia sp. NPDC127579]|uniref:relaxase/mobilization nuclease domain-containing protein n=1 Tax=Nocardia sp. NPDC127579 TaxID=3345402 RepID=UPI0036368496